MRILSSWWHRKLPGGFDLRNVMGEPVPVDDRIEPIVRRTLEAVVKQKPAGLDAALASFPDHPSRMQGLHLAGMIATLALHDVYAGRPTAEQLGAIVPAAAKMTGWAGVSADDVAQFCVGLIDGRLPFTPIDLDDFSRIVYVTTGCLLASSVKLQRGEWWFQYLDRLEAALEAGPARDTSLAGRWRGPARRPTAPADLGLDDRVEPLVRNALSAAAAQDPDRLADAMLAFSDAVALIKGIRLAAAVAVLVVTDLHHGKRPTAAELAEVAADIAAAEDWTDITADEIVILLTAAYDGKRVDDLLPMDRVIAMSFVVTASLLASYRDDGEQWWDYLDRAEAIIEASLNSQQP